MSLSSCLSRQFTFISKLSIPTLLPTCPMKKVLMVAKSRPHTYFAIGPNEELVRTAVLERELVDAAKGETESVAFALNDFVLAAELELPGR